MHTFPFSHKTPPPPPPPLYEKPSTPSTYQLVYHFPISSFDQCTPCHTQITVKPCVPQSTTIGLHVDHGVPALHTLADRLELETGTVGVCVGVFVGAFDSELVGVFCLWFRQCVFSGHPHKTCTLATQKPTYLSV